MFELLVPAEKSQLERVVTGKLTILSFGYA